LSECQRAKAHTHFFAIPSGGRPALCQSVERNWQKRRWLKSLASMRCCTVQGRSKGRAAVEVANAQPEGRAKMISTKRDIHTHTHTHTHTHLFAIPSGDVRRCVRNPRAGIKGSTCGSKVVCACCTVRVGLRGKHTHTHTHTPFSVGPGTPTVCPLVRPWETGCPNATFPQVSAVRDCLGFPSGTLR